MKKKAALFALVFCMASLSVSPVAPQQAAVRQENLKTSSYNVSARKAYKAYLSKLRTTGKVDSSTTLNYENMMGDGRKAQKFAIKDVDKDGKVELALRVTDDTSAGSMELLFQYVPGKQELQQEFLEYWGIRYYADGACCRDSHQQGPNVSLKDYSYTAYKYQEDQDAYVEICHVQPWEKEAPESFYGAYPVQYDTDGSGIVYEMRDTAGKTRILSRTAYRKWFKKHYKSKTIRVKFHSLTEKNIGKYC